MHKLQPAAPAHDQMDVIVIGEALIDVVNGPEGSISYPGGSPANVAYGLGRLGIPTGLLTAIGDDEHGTAITNHLHSAGVRLLPGSISLERTATATATLAADGSASYEFDIAWQLAPVAPAMIPKVLHTGSIATFLAPGAATVRTLLEQCHQSCLVTYDPNIRPALLGSHSEAQSVFEDLLPLTDVVKLSDEDAHWLYPAFSPDEVLSHLLEQGARLAVITKGAEGALLATPDARFSISSVKTKVADTIGAGDAYMAALIFELLTRGDEAFTPPGLEAIGQTASMAAAITVSRPGANPPTAEELQTRLAGPRRRWHTVAYS
ncbi:carbohydrate kinase family protein [Arthrobacter bambusae]|uniref:Fructokinase n=1 Tax=Arthrobacter bambusae TaxID=1338426 RepID=A0AAW8DKB3_9MICC|nr:carbohydrate kinase [Arthrobacter bambusae]MDP9905433.1 fructokinase [Arthrobacter bambusae]MDQ0127485.1 fructokinase [Arthrobacter bambusae]MDQ0178827.1 fructokinase [Arthrobacter bambusae]